MKFIHTADWQIGMKAAHAGGVGTTIREQRHQAARRVVQAAKDHAADFLLLAGDTFEDNAVDRVLIQKVADILAGFPGPVYLIPGNHDPLVPGSVWEHPAWRSHQNLKVLVDRAPIDIPGGRLYPCPLRERHSPQDPTAWIHAEDTRGIALGLAHGTVEGVQQEEPDYPIARAAATRARLDYLALGHWHSTAYYADGAQTPRMAYSGTHETTKFGERDSGNVLLVQITGRGEPPQITPLKTGGLCWLQFVETVRSRGDLARIRQAIESLSDSQNTLLSVCLRGVLDPDDQPELARLDELARTRFLYQRIDVSALVPSPEDERWLTRLPAGPLQEAARRLQALCDPSLSEGRPDEATPEVAARALIELYALVHEVGE